jgi:hypothetical protein
MKPGLFYARLLLDLFFDPEEGGLIEMKRNVHPCTEDGKLHNRVYQNRKPHIDFLLFLVFP